MQWADQVKPDSIDLYVYKGADGSFTLYEDENVNYNYEKGAYAMIEFTYDDESGILSIGERKGEYPGMIQERIFNVIQVSPAGKSSPMVVRYEGKSVNVQL